MRAAVIDRPGKLIIADQPIPAVGPDEVLIRVMASGICGTDIHIFRGEYMGSYPVVPGHEFSGTVEGVGSAVTRFKPGDRVAVEPNIACDDCPACLSNRQNFCENWQAIGVTLSGGMAEFVAAPEKAVFGIGGLDFESGAFVEPLSCVLHGVERADIRMGDRVLIIGAGPIGLLLSKTFALRGACEITHVDRNRERLAMAERSGAARVESSLEALTGDEFDVVVDATGVPSVMERTLPFTRPGGTVLLFGVPPNGAKLSLDAFTIFRRGLRILSSFTSVRNTQQAVRLLASGRIEVADLVSHTLPLDDFEKGIGFIERGDEGAMKVIILPGERL